jgi:ketosteroid isomerase-like protein
MKETGMSADEQAVRAALDAWHQAIQQLDFPAMAGMWDAAFPGRLVYQPEEYEEPFCTYDDIKEYWGRVPAVVTSVPEWRALSTEVAVVQDVAVAYSRLWTSIRIKDVDKSFDGELRCSYAFRRTPDGWRLIHYHESRLVSVESVVASLTG